MLLSSLLSTRPAHSHCCLLHRRVPEGPAVVGPALPRRGRAAACARAVLWPHSRRRCPPRCLQRQQGAPGSSRRRAGEQRPLRRFLLPCSTAAPVLAAAASARSRRWTPGAGGLPSRGPGQSERRRLLVSVADVAGRVCIAMFSFGLPAAPCAATCGALAHQRSCSCGAAFRQCESTALPYLAEIQTGCKNAVGLKTREHFFKAAGGSGVLKCLWTIFLVNVFCA